MDAKEMVRQAWSSAGLFQSTDPKLQEFLRQFDQAGTDCWPEFMSQLREKYPGCMSQLLRPIWETGDRMLRLGVLRMLDVTQEDERNLIQDIIKMCRPEEDALELQIILHKDHPELLEPLRDAVGLPNPAHAEPGSQLEMVRSLLNVRRSQLSQHRSARP